MTECKHESYYFQVGQPLRCLACGKDMTPPKDDPPRPQLRRIK